MFAGPLSASQREMESAFRQLERITDMQFKREVPFKRQTRDQFQQFLREEMDKTFPGDQLRDLGRLYSMLGLVPRDYRLEERLPKLYRDQVGAYYDPATETIYQVAGDLDPASQFFLYLHEGVHALQDQHFDLEEKQTRYARSTSLDRQIAFSFVTEGHANLVAMAAQMQTPGLNERFFNTTQFEYIFRLMSRLTELTDGQFEAITRLLGGDQTPTARSLDKLRDVPLVLVQQMTDPYLLGQYIWYQRAQRIGFDRSMDWLRNPPNSTQAIFFDGAHYRRNPFRSIGDYETTLGSYLLMRWLNIFSSQPDWVAQVGYDRVSVIGPERDRAGLLRISFEEESAMDSFKEALGQFVDRTADGESGTDHLLTFDRGDQPRYLWHHTNDNRLWLFFDDDSTLRPEFEHESLKLDFPSPGPLSTGEANSRSNELD